MIVDFELTASDKASSLWARLKDHYLDRLADARARNDVVQSEQNTAAIRGEIKSLKNLISLGDDRPVFLTGDE